MQTFLAARVRPEALRVDDADNVAQHCRWAVDAYREVGAIWLGGVVTPDRMFSLVVAEQADDLARYWARIGVTPSDACLSPVVRMLGPYFAASQP